jgi:O-antigen ligase
MQLFRVIGVAAFVLLGTKYLRPGGVPLFSVVVLVLTISALNSGFRNTLTQHVKWLFIIFWSYLMVQMFDLLRATNFNQSVFDLIKYIGLLISIYLFTRYYRFQHLMTHAKWFAVLSAVLLLYFFINSVFVLKSGFLSADLYIRTEQGKNGLAMFSAISCIVSFWLLISTSERKRYLFFLPCLFVSLSSLIYTQSRGAFIVLLLSSLVVYLRFLYHRSGERLYRLLKLGAAVSIFVLFLAYVFTAFSFFDEHAYFEQLTSLGTGRLTGSDEARQVLLQRGWRLFLDHPLIGIGTHNFEHRYELLTHNQYLQFAAENGFFMAVAVIIVFVAITRNFFKWQGHNSSNTLFHIAFNTAVFIFLYFIFINAYDSILTEFCLVISARILDDSIPKPPAVANKL